MDGDSRLESATDAMEVEKSDSPAHLNNCDMQSQPMQEENQSASTKHSQVLPETEPPPEVLGPPTKDSNQAFLHTFDENGSLGVEEGGSDDDDVGQRLNPQSDPRDQEVPLGHLHDADNQEISEINLVLGTEKVTKIAEEVSD